MSRASRARLARRLGALVVPVLATLTLARAHADDLDEHTRAAAVAAPLSAAAPAPASATDPDLRARLAAQLAAEASTIARTLTIVDRKVGEAEAIRMQRLRAAYRLLRAPLRASASPADRMAAARRRASARLLVDRDARERALLADEAGLLRAASDRTVVATHTLPTLTLPGPLAWPARGEIARRFGTLAHDRSKAVLSRRGIDFEVATGATASAPADGVVRYAGPIRGLDEGVIIEHGDYFTVVAKLGDLTVPVGAPVKRGDRLGRAARKRVYLELRVRIGPGGVPIDPEPLLDNSR